jgi:hypothetical protein
MHCYKHREEVAIAVCRNCGRAACADCCEVSGQEISCSAICAEELRESLRLTNKLKQSYGLGPNPPMPASVATYFFFGLILLITGVYLTLTRPDPEYLTFSMSAIFFVMSAGAYKRFRDGCAECK